MCLVNFILENICWYIHFFLRYLFGFAISNLATSFSPTTVELQHSDVSWLGKRKWEGKRWKDMIYLTFCWYFVFLHVICCKLYDSTWQEFVISFFGHLQVQCNPPPAELFVPSPGLASHSRPFALFTRWWQCLWGRRWPYLQVCEIERIFRVPRIKRTNYMVVFKNCPYVVRENHPIWHHVF